ncbi:MAG: HPr kinase/phosphatase C-terminal domain-containing protein [Aestuariivita sp.]|nr:HPr kinase/phosphatase C-terminal domain-containing protein [Aestuariivita sp.]
MSERSSMGCNEAMQQVLHASCVAFHRRAVLIMGRAMSGKSSLALELISGGALLVSDDQTIVSLGSSGLVADAPSEIKGFIEARGVGLLRAHTHGPAQIALVVDLDRDETERLPPVRSYDILGQEIPILFRVRAPYFPVAILQYLKGGLAHEKY